MHAVVASNFAARKRTRPHQRHLAAENVPELRQLIDRVPAAESSEAAGYAAIGRILVVLVRLRDDSLDPVALARKRWAGGPHGSKFEHPERRLVMSHTQVR